MCPTCEGVPPWVLKLHHEARRLKFVGWLSFNYRAGDPRHVERKDVIFAPQEPATPLCPRGCGPMESRDGGTLWVCECGTKRTAAQLAQASGR